ncbi:hypothetical protein RCL1_007053 [Eukaryota sp. TZLM3-RCL]
MSETDLSQLSVDPAPVPSTTEPTTSSLSLEERYNLILSIGEEVIQPEELHKLLEKKPLPIAYDGFEPSGRMHIAQGLMKAINVNKLVTAGVKVIYYVADYFAMLNNKCGGDLNKIQTIGKYMIEVWKSVGMKTEGMEFIWSSDFINANHEKYWKIVMDIARLNSVTRIKRCCQIMGRNEEEELTAAQIMYPCMQAADIFALGVDLCQLGLDQRKVNMLAREYATERKLRKPVIVSNHMLMGLIQGQAKMSKSHPDSAIFMEDAASDVNGKIKRAFCPPGIVEDNPVLDYFKYIVFPAREVGLNGLTRDQGVTVSRSEQNGGNITYVNFEDMARDYTAELLHPGDLKPALAAEINSLLEPVRQHFVDDAEAKKLLTKVKQIRITR